MRIRTHDYTVSHKNYKQQQQRLQNSEPQNGPRSGLDYIALQYIRTENTLHKQSEKAYMCF